ncbi:substrate-binding periplasmic protein [Dongshaea marina]|uniref:substrate-binding periplasmic protein n=1 Tax=Dongshaea marina TaxID=2047966 RepID=UPI000D3E22A5|nr:transporter substrate-binding domain-containing protein [Dongshaea marina]
MSNIPTWFTDRLRMGHFSRLGHVIRSRVKRMRLLLLLPLLSCSLNSHSEELLVVTENWRPYNYEEFGEVKGLSTEIVKKVLERAGIKYQIKVYPWARAYRMAQEDKSVMIYTIIRIPTREKLFKWVRPLGRGGVTSLYRLKKNKHISPITLQEAKSYRIGANKDSMDHLWLQDNGFHNLYTPHAVELTIKMFFYDRFDMIAFDDSTMKSEFSHYGWDPNRAVHVMPLFRTPPYIALSLATPDSIKLKLQEAYDSLMKEEMVELVN